MTSLVPAQGSFSPAWRLSRDFERGGEQMSSRLGRSCARKELRAHVKLVVDHVIAVYLCTLNGWKKAALLKKSFGARILIRILAACVGPRRVRALFGRSVSGGSGVGDVWRGEKLLWTAVTQEDF